MCVGQASDLASHITRFQNDIHRCVGMIQDPPKLKELITHIYHTHVQDNFVRRPLHDAVDYYIIITPVHCQINNALVSLH